MSPASRGFDRIRPRNEVAPEHRVVEEPDRLRVLFSPPDVEPVLGGISISCSRCGATEVVSLTHFARLALPSLHVPVLRGEHPSFIRCPACNRRSWVKLEIRL